MKCKSSPVMPLRKCLPGSEPTIPQRHTGGQVLFPSALYTASQSPILHKHPHLNSPTDTRGCLKPLAQFFSLSRNSLSSPCASTPTTWNQLIVPNPPVTLPQLKEVIDVNPPAPLTNLDNLETSKNGFLNCSNSASLTIRINLIFNADFDD